MIGYMLTRCGLMALQSYAGASMVLIHLSNGEGVLNVLQAIGFFLLFTSNRHLSSGLRLQRK
ncbi:MAG: hypothetical protein DRJ97_08220 [Thermoprotei archaeon]|nr:MAG: hypothetical protein DRJ97_08220 [Thermoprotei archaeon]